MERVIKGLNKWTKRSIAFSSDFVMTSLALISMQWLTQRIFSSSMMISFLLLQSLIFVGCGLYRGVWRFASIPDLFRIFRAVMLGSVALMVLCQTLNFIVSLKSAIIYALLLIIFLATPRLTYRWFRDFRNLVSEGKRVLVIGAGNAGEGIIRDLRRAALNKFIPVGFVDDNPTRLGCEIHGVRIVGTCQDIPALVDKYAVDLILIAIPSASSTRMREIVSFCEQSNVEFRTLPGLRDITDGNVSINALREVLLEDLLGREEVLLDWRAIEKSILHKSILVTGGGGSIGSELCRQISRLSPKKLIIVESNEYNLYMIDLELRAKFPALSIHSQLCNITDRNEIEKIFETHMPQLVFHVAAYKHVPLLEKQIRVAMFNNIIGTRNVAELSSIHRAETFVLISTDKAVNPTSIMGATKRASEVFCQNFNLHSATKFTTVRFGNVLDSTGSVIPLFRKQLQSGGPLTVTHPEVSRYFMTIPEASQLILQAVTMNKNGEIFVLDMGEPINIRYLAEQMIKFSGKVVGKDIKIRYIGLRPGEKLHEELFHTRENTFETSHPKIKRANSRLFDWQTLKVCVTEIERACQTHDEKRLNALLCQLVPEYGKPTEQRQANAAYA